MKIKLALTRTAQKRGGDRYEAIIDGEDKAMALYIPQMKGINYVDL